MNDFSILDESVEDFLEALGLPSHHPFVERHETTSQEAPDERHEGPGHHEWTLMDFFTPHGHCQAARTTHRDSKVAGTSEDWWPGSSYLLEWLEKEYFAIKLVFDQVLETFHQVWPSLRGSFHLTLRLFAPLILVGALVHLFVVSSWQHSHLDDDHVTSFNRSTAISSYVALGIMILIMTDECYIQEYGRVKLWSVASIVLALVVVVVQRHSCCHSLMQSSILVLTVFVVVAFSMTWYCQVYIPSFEPGLYFSQDNPIMSKIVCKWPIEKRTYDNGTPWLITGDARTGVPFFLNSIPPQAFVRRWVPSNVPGETEACILDIAFPSDGIHRKDKPIYLVLHGLNGGSNEEYVRDFCMRATSNGSTVAILVTRGLMDSPVLGENLPHFARMSDINCAARALRKAAAPNQTLGGVGYSMGAINLATYVASTGKDCPLDAAVALSGALDTRKQVDFHRSKRFWQPMLSKTLRDTFLSKFSTQLANRLSQQQVKFLSQVDSLVSLDEALMVPYNGYMDLNAYYADMGAMADFQSWDNDDTVGRIANVSIPLIMISALDDPIGYIDTFIDPDKVCKSGSGYTSILLTRTGGHVGWPVGWNPTRDGWKWMSEAAISFCRECRLCIPARK